ncbi:MAG: hypothetical protein H7138_15765, partial [Myxococcales bacterium]|nr:hypothetical protein [Myxococcales bacterium]
MTTRSATWCCRHSVLGAAVIGFIALAQSQMPGCIPTPPAQVAPKPTAQLAPTPSPSATA